MNTSLLILSCDAFEDTWAIHHKLMKKYWYNCPYETFLMTETKSSKLFKTIKTTGAWTKRLREALEQINTKYVLITLDDFFLRDYVDQQRINEITSRFGDNTAVYNFEKCYSLPTIAYGLNGFKIRQNKTPYLNSCQPSLHNRLKLIERLQEDMDVWSWELSTVDSPYDFMVNSSTFIMDIGYYDHKPWSIKQGKWCREIIPFFAKEQIEVDYEKRGFWD